MKNIVLCVLLVSVAAFAQDQPPTGGRPQIGVPGGRIMTATRTVTKYSTLERELLQALQDKSVDQLDKSLANDFEVWSGEKESPTPRADWIAAHNGENAFEYRIRNMAVREFGDTAVVSFMLDRNTLTRNKPIPHTMFIVDIWRQSEGKLVVRYECAPAGPAKGRLQPTGKE